jgi:crossover junction endonuclease MUS81
MPLKPGQTAPTANPFQETDLPTQVPKRRPLARQYIPKYRSGGWAILRALETFPPDASKTKADIVRVAHQYCDSSFDTPLDNKFYTAWSSMKNLLERGYVYKSGNPPRFSLTEEGAEVARKLANLDGGVTVHKENEGPAQKRQKSEEPPTSSWIPPESLVFDWEDTQVLQPVRMASQGSSISRSVPARNDVDFLPAGSYTIQLVMDNREIHSQVDRERLEREIGEGGVDYSVRGLDIGDALWIAKSASGEYVLDYIVERKRMDDLVGSITDGRFHEQKVPLPKQLRMFTIVPIDEIWNESCNLHH